MLARRFRSLYGTSQIVELTLFTISADTEAAARAIRSIL